MGARVFHHPLAIRVYEWVEIPVYGADQGETWLAIRVYEWVEISRISIRGEARSSCNPCM